MAFSVNKMNEMSRHDPMKHRFVPHDADYARHCRCECVHDKLQKRLTLGAIVVAFFAVAVSLYTLWANIQHNGQSCNLDEKDRKLLKEFRSLKTLMLQKQTEDEPSELPLQTILQNVGEMSVRNIVKRDTEDTTEKPQKSKSKGKGRRKKKGKAKGRRRKKHYLAAHYVPKFWSDRNSGEFKQGMCIMVENWGGRACRNRTLEMKNRGIMQFFHQAEWVNKNHNIRSPTVLKDGKFEVEESGLYLLYSSVSASVLFYDSKKKQSQAIMKNKERLFKCMEGLDYIETGNGNEKPHQSKYKTCSITGVTYLKKGDKLSVNNMYENTVMDLSDDSTFFGLVQLLPSGK